jgi:Zn-dependent protease
LLLIALALLLYAALSGGLVGPLRTWQTDPNRTVGFVVAIILGITIHEFMHAYSAYRLGDDTGRLLGRLSLNPLAHFDLFGTLLLVLAGFGYGKPVPFNESRLRSPTAVAIVAAAGPLSNFAIALVCAIPLRFAATSLVGAYGEILAWIVYWNCILGVFNLIPIPPLDGSGVVISVFGGAVARLYAALSRFGFLILLGLLYLGALNWLFAPVYRLVRIIIFGGL